MHSRRTSERGATPEGHQFGHLALSIGREARTSTLHHKKRRQVTASEHRLPPPFVASLGRDWLAFGFYRLLQAESRVQSDEFRSRGRRAKKNKKNMGQYR